MPTAVAAPAHIGAGIARALVRGATVRGAPPPVELERQGAVWRLAVGDPERPAIVLADATLLRLLAQLASVLESLPLHGEP